MPETEGEDSSSHYRHRIASSRTSESESSSSTSSLSLPTPPDGGWGWMVVFASFMIHLIADGCAFSFGVLYVELLEYFGESKGKTAWVGSLFVSVPLITGPIASALTNRYGCRRSTIVGGLIAAIGFVASAFADSIEALCFTFGIIAGFGLSMVYVPAVIIVAYYFEKKRAFATGIAVAGSGIGTFVFAPMTEYLIQIYTWRGTVIIIGGIMLNIMVCGAVFRPLADECKSKKKRVTQKISTNSSRQDFGDEHKLCNGHLHGLPDDVKFLTLLQELNEPVAHSLIQFPTYLHKELDAVAPDLLKDLKSSGKPLNEVLRGSDLMEKYYATQSLTNIGEEEETEDQTHYENSSGINDAIVEQTENNEEEETENSIALSKGEVALLAGTSSSPTQANGDTNNQLSRRRELIWQKQARHHRLIRNRLTDQYWPMYRKDIFYRGSLVRSGFVSSSDRAASCPDIMMHQDCSSEDSEESLWLFKCLKFSKEVKTVMKEMLDIAILRSVIFVYFSISCMILYMWYDVPYVYSPHKAISMGISDEMASFLVSILGIVSTVGQIVIGYIGDRPGVNALHVYNALTSIAGVATMLVPILDSYLGLAIYSGAFGFFISANYALTTIILVDLLGMEKLTNAYGLIMLAEGISNLIGPPLAGWLSDRTGSYDLTFYSAGIGILISGLMLCAIPWLYRCDKLYQSKHQQDNESKSSTCSPSSSPSHSIQQNGHARVEKMHSYSSVPELLVITHVESTV